LLWSLASRNNHVDRQTLPDEVCRQHDHVRSVWPHPFRQRAGGDQPTTNELPARVLGALVIDRAAMLDSKRTRRPRANLVAPNFDLQPAVAASGAGATASSVVGLFHPAVLCRRSIAARTPALPVLKASRGAQVLSCARSECALIS
jgi:hypothetical protein